MSTLLILALVPFLAPTEPEAARPNILWLSCEDMSPHLGCYGDPVAQTPHVDRLASQGIRYTNACSAAGVCAPCRSSIITAMYPTTLGTHLMRCRASLPDFVKTFPTLLRAAGYYCTNNSKTDYQFEVPKGTWDESSGKAHWRHRAKGQPFFAVFNYTGSHESATVLPTKNNGVTQGLTKVSREAASKTLPPYYPRTAATIEEWGRYYDCISAMDRWVGERLKELNDAGLADDTIIFFWSDHGVGLPRAKRTIYDSGVHVPLVVSIPPKFGGTGKGSIDDQLVSLMDLGPTVLNLAGVPIPEYMQGVPFLGPSLPPPRDALFLVRDRMDERYDMMRGVRTKRYEYIINFQPWKPLLQPVAYGEQSTIMKEIRRLSAEDKLDVPGLVGEPRKPVEELYDLEADPHEIHNLADSPSHQEILATLRHRQEEWSETTRDLGLLPEAEIARREKEYGSRFAILQGDDGLALVRRLRQAALAAGTPEENHSRLTGLLEDPDPAVRYWAIIGLGNLERPSSTDVEDARKAMAGQPAVVAVATARLMLQAGQKQPAIELLRPALGDENPWVRLEAAHVVEQYADDCLALRDAMIALSKSGKVRSDADRYPADVARAFVPKLPKDSR